MKFLLGFIGPVRVAGFIFGLLLLSLFDLIGIAVIFPYLKVISEPALIHSNTYLSSVYNMIGFSSAEQFIYAISGMLALFFTLKTIVSFFLSKHQFKGLARLGYDLTELLFDKLMRTRYAFFLHQPPSELVGMNYTYSAQVSLCFQSWLGIINELIFFSFFLLAALFVAPVATSVIIGILAVLATLLYLLVVRRTARYGKEQARIDSARYKWSFATITSIKDAKIMGLGNIFLERTVELARLNRENTWRSGLVAASPKMGIEYVILICFVGAAVGFMNSGIAMETILPLLGLLGLSALRVLPAFGRLIGYYNNFKYSKAYLQRLIVFYADLQRNQQTITHVVQPFTKEIEIRNLRFSYGDKVVLNNISMTVPRGKSIGIVGSSGSGKSTLLDVITGLQEKGSGEFLVDGNSVDPYSTDAIRKYVGYVPQQIALIDESIAFNISFLHDYDKDKIQRVLKIANLDKFVDTLPEGCETFVGEGGVRLSGGQKQRLGIARALYRDPELLIFDEATSALDNVTEKELSREILALSGNKTLIIVAHRLTTVVNCDVLYVVDHGKISASGTHAELLVSCPLYRTMNQASAMQRNHVAAEHQLL